MPATLHEKNRKRLVEQLRSDASLPSGSVILLMGGKTANLYNTDVEPVFRQESYFHWTFGVLEPDFYGAIDLQSGKCYLFAPKLPMAYSIWMGKLYTPQDFSNRYSVDEVYYTEQVISQSMIPVPTFFLLFSALLRLVKYWIN